MKVNLKVNVKPILKRRGISMRQFAIDIDYNRDQVRKFCNNEMKHLPIELIEKTCEALNKDLHEIIVNESDENFN